MNKMLYSDNWQSILIVEAGKTGVSLSPGQAKQLAIHAEEVMQTNKKFNLTSITDPIEVMVKHVIDSLAVTQYIEKKDARIIDVGTGGGFPGIPIKIAMPETDVTLVDRSRKKNNFLNYVIRKLDLRNIRAVHTRVEEMDVADDSNGGFDIAVSRAFTSLNRIITVVSPLLKASGEIIAMKGSSVNGEIVELPSSLIESGCIEKYNYTLPVLNLSRAVVRIRFRHLNRKQVKYRDVPTPAGIKYS